MGTFGGKVKLPETLQLGIVVKDLQKVMEFYDTVLGIGPWVVRNGVSDSRAGDKTFTYTITSSFAPLGPATVELFQVVEGRSPVHCDWLDKGREGLHHLGFYGSKEERERIPLELAKIGIGVVQERVTNAFLDTETTGGVFFEIIDHRPPVFEQEPKPGRGVTLPPSLQVGLVVKNVDTVARFYESVFGIGPWNRREVRFEGTANSRTHRFRANLAFTTFGGVVLELFELVEGTSPVHSHWVKSGREGVHHLGFYTTSEERDRIVTQLGALGVHVAQHGRATSAAYTFVDTERTGGLFFELIVRDP